MKKKLAANSAFFQNAGQGGNGVVEIMGAGAGDLIEEGGRDNGGSISEKGLMMAFKRAKTSGAFIVQNGGLKEVPDDLCTFDKYKVPDENWWDAHELNKVDLSNNLLETIKETLSTQITI